MHHMISKISTQYVSAGIIEEEMAEWFVYALEKRIITAISASLFFLIAASVSNARTAFAYLSSFYFLRSRTSGYHAKTFISCLCCSILLELFFLLVLLPMLTATLVYLLNLISLIVVFIYAPLNHPNMHMDANEVIACRRSARVRIFGLITLVMILNVYAINDIIYGITLGNAMTALLLVYKNENLSRRIT